MLLGQCGSISPRNPKRAWLEGRRCGAAPPGRHAGCGSRLQSGEHRGMRWRRWLYGLLGLTGGIALLGMGLSRLTPPPLILNLSASLPRGLYFVRHVAMLE